jgi:hypothetical protein
MLQNTARDICGQPGIDIVTISCDNLFQIGNAVLRFAQGFKKI